MRYLSVCSGIEAASVAWHPLGWEPVAFAEVEPFPSAVLAHHYPNVPNWGDMTRYEEWPDAAFDVLVGGTPCQSFSVAGKRGGMDDPRGQLAYAFAGIAARYKPEWIVWENVPGVLSSAGGRDFAGFVRGLGELGYQCAWRIFDAQFFGVPQRRRRLFLIGNSGGWQRAAAVLFERESMLGNPPPSRKAREVAPTIPARSLGGGGLGTDFDCDGGVVQVCPTLRAGGNRTGGDRPPGTDVDTVESLICIAHGQGGAEIGFDRGPTPTCNHEAPIIAHSLRGEGFDASEDGTGRGKPLVPAAIPIISDADRADSSAQTPSPDAEGRIRLRDPGLGIGDDGDPMFTLQATKPHAVAFDTTQITSPANYSNPKPGDPCHPLAAGAHPPAVAFDILGTLATNAAKETSVHVALRARAPGQSEASTTTVAMTNMQVRRLTPVECERLQGFPDGYTAIPIVKRQPIKGQPAVVKAAADGPRYKALGNSMAVPVMRWIGSRIDKLMEVA